MRTGAPTPTVTLRACTDLGSEERREDGRFAPEEPPTCPPSHAHSTWCYNSHGCKCSSCRDAWSAARRKTYRTSRVRKAEPILIGSAPIVRRLRALAVIGYGLGELSELIGANRSNLAEIRRGERRTVRVATAQKIVSAYRRLHMTPSKDPRAAIIADRARKVGYHSPLHWVDIDKGTADDELYG